MMRSLAAGLMGLCLSAAAAAEIYEAQPIEVLLDQSTTYDATIPTPEQVHGYRSGAIIATPEMLQTYARAVAAVSDRVSVEIIGHSHFGRPIMRVTTTSPANHARLEDIRQAHLAISDPANTDPIPDDMPVIIQFTHGVHGSEASGYDASAPLLYFLAAAEDEDTRALLERTVVTQIIQINPDGATRFANHINSHHGRVAVTDPDHREHTGFFPYGRTNQYWFDINRQWLPVTQPEAVALVAATHYWRPNLAIDLHEMGEDQTFFYSPGPLNQLHPLLSRAGFALTQELNTGIQAQLDGEGAVSTTEEFYDDFYLGYGSSYPGLVGSVAYLFEQSSARGLMRETENGVVRYDDKVGQQARVAISLIRSADERRGELLRFQRSFAQETLRLAASNPVNAYVFTSHDRGRLADFLAMLDVHEIEVHALSQPITANGIRFRPGEAFVVPLRQANYRVIEGLFETRIVDGGVEFYDVSGWTLPLAYDLDYAPLRAGLFQPSATGDIIEGFDRAAPPPANSTLAYVMDWSAFHAPRALYRLLDAGVRARVIPDAVQLQTTEGEVTAPRGSVLVTVARQSLSAEAIHMLMQRAAAEDGVTVHATTTAYTGTGSDLGGFDLANIETPEILLLTGESVSLNEAGEIWHLLDFEMEMPVTMIDTDRFGRANLERYTHIVLTSGDFSDLGEAGAERLGEWVRAGGVLIGMRSGARFIVENELASVELADTAMPPAEEAEVHATQRPYQEIDLWDVEHDIAGAIFAAELDITHPLGYGYRDGLLPVHRMDTMGFIPDDNPFSIPLRYRARSPLLSGYASDRNQQQMAGLGSVFAERRGGGAVILFADNPYYRAYFRGTSKMFMNAIFFGNDFRNPARRGG